MEGQTKEAYCSLAVSRLLIDKGFDWPSRAFYRDGKIERLFGEMTQNELNQDLTLAPTHQMAAKWLREKFNIYVDVIFRPFYKYYFEAYKVEGGKIIDWCRNDCFATYEEAVEAALHRCLAELL